LKFIIS